MKTDNRIFNRIYSRVLENLDTPNEIDDTELDDRCFGANLSDKKTLHHVCKDIQAIRMLLADIEKHFGITDDNYSVEDIDHCNLHNFIVDRLNNNCCNSYTKYYIFDDILSDKNANSSNIMHALWCH